MTRRLTVITYDISASVARRRVAGLLEHFAVRVQESVFEAHLTETQRERLLHLLTPHVGPGDSVRVYVIPGTHVAETRVIGAGRPPEAGPFLVF